MHHTSYTIITTNLSVTQPCLRTTNKQCGDLSYLLSHFSLVSTSCTIPSYPKHSILFSFLCCELCFSIQYPSTCTMSYICFTANTKQVCKVLVLQVTLVLVLFAVSSELQIQNKSATYSSYFLHLLHWQFKQVCKCHPPKWYKRRCKLWIEHQCLSSPLD